MTLTDQERRRLIRVRALTWAGIIATSILFWIAMAWFPGEGRGAQQGYSFSGHFLSAMGKTRAGSSDNSVSCLIFNGTLLMVGAILVVFWKTRATFLTQPATGMALRGFGLMMGLTMAGIGLTPYDHFPRTHNLMTYAVIVFGVICFGLCFFGTHQEFESAKSKRGWLAILIVIGAAYALFMLLALQRIVPSRPALPLMQKLFVLLLVVWAGWQSLLFGRACRTAPAAAESEEDIRR